MPAAPSDRTGAFPRNDAAHPDRPGRDRRPRLVSDLRRFWLASAVSAGLAVAWVVVVVVVQPGRVGGLPFVATVYFGAWVAYSLSYLLLT